MSVRACIQGMCFAVVGCLAVGSMVACGDDDGTVAGMTGFAPGTLPGSNGGTDADAPDFDTAIYAYDGARADDAANDVVGTNEDLFWEANTFTEKVYVVYDGDRAQVSTTNPTLLYNVDGAYVTLDLLTHSLKQVEIVVSGKSDDGQLKIYGEKKFKLTLDGLELTSTRGPAINDQCKKRAFVHVAPGTVNRLTDASAYGDDPYYLDAATATDEDRKGCFFSEGNLIFSGTGLLLVEGNCKHGLATDGYLYVRPGVTLVVTGTAKNAIHAKGDADEGMGIYIAGGLLYAHTAAAAGKALKSDNNVVVAGGTLLLNTSGRAEYDAEEQDTSSPACIKADGDVTIAGGTLTLKSTGDGGKGIRADGRITVSGGTTTVTTTGGQYVYNRSQGLTSSPKGVRADGDILIDGGALNVSVTGASDGSEGVESKSAFTLNDGCVYVYAYDDGINASTDITLNGGRTYCFSVTNDGIDSNGTLHLNGGLAVACGLTSPEEGFDCDRSDLFRITGGTFIGLGSTVMASPSTASMQRSVVYNGLSLSKGSSLCLLSAAGAPVFTYALPCTVNGASLLVSSADLTEGSYTLSAGGTLTGATDSWGGWLGGGTWSGGSELGTFTLSGVVTTVGSGFGTGGPGGGFGGGHGGDWGGGPGGGRP